MVTDNGRSYNSQWEILAKNDPVAAVTVYEEAGRVRSEFIRSERERERSHVFRLDGILRSDWLRDDDDVRDKGEQTPYLMVTTATGQLLQAAGLMLSQGFKAPICQSILIDLEFLRGFQELSRDPWKDSSRTSKAPCLVSRLFKDYMNILDLLSLQKPTLTLAWNSFKVLKEISKDFIRLSLEDHVSHNPPETTSRCPGRS
ncbi:Hypothetical predicted protein [Xyrichtys novacula]|uniref:Uncharacterized protein n=1 Tax=Xyrichtys novacula TaxID=13765 RepID=A0AAV1EI27_XYRNO|nr:Hypothetical predicted protein [Xyrichtys novacula]